MDADEKGVTNVYTLGGQQVLTILINGQPWFVLADVCRVLGIGNPSDAARRLVDDQKHTLDNVEGIASAQVQTFTVINESGLYALIFTSRKAAARRFTKWIMAEVIPASRRTGGYGTPAPAVNLNDPATLRGLLADYAERVAASEAQLALAAPKVEALDRLATAARRFSTTARAIARGAKRAIFHGLLGQMLGRDFEGLKKTLENQRFSAGLLVEPGGIEPPTS